MNLALVANSGGSCAFSANSAEGMCMPKPNNNGWSIYVDTCAFSVEEKDICYHVPSSDNSVFGS